MSDSHGELPASAAGEQQATHLRKLASDENSGSHEPFNDSPPGTPPTDPTVSKKGVRVRIDSAHAIGDPAPHESAAENRHAAAEAGGEQAPEQDDLQSSGAEPPIEFEPQAIADAAAEMFSVEKLQQMRLQFEQLAGHLRSQQYQLDRRESQLHSQLAQQENEIRTTRLWFREQQQALAEREAEFERRGQQTEAEQLARLAERNAELAQREQEFESQRAALMENLSRREAELTSREVEFDLQSAECDVERAEWVDGKERFEAECREAKREWQEQADMLAVKHRELELERLAMAQQAETLPKTAAESSVAEHAGANAEQFHRDANALRDLLCKFLSGEQTSAGAASPADAEMLIAEFRTAIGKLETRQKNLEESEALLIDGQTALQRARKQLTADRQAWQEQCDIERRRIGDDRRRIEADLHKKQRAIAERTDHLERRSAAVDQLRSEVLRAQRETLELRLATDEIWAQLAGSVPPPVLTQSLARIRAKLAEQYQLERAELSDLQKQLESLAARMESQHDKLHEQKQALEQWVADRRQEIEGQASRLVAQEMEIARRQNELEEINERQESERRLYEAEIRRLLGELRRSDRATVAAA